MLEDTKTSTCCPEENNSAAIVCKNYGRKLPEFDELNPIADDAVIGRTTMGNNEDYAGLKNLVKEAGLMKKQPRYFIRKILLNFGLMSINLAILLLSDNIWIQVLNAAFLAFIFTQMSFIVHDTGHRQPFRNTRQNDLFGLIHGNLMLGMSYGWWIRKHNKHHSSPNLQDGDPDIDFPMIAFSEEDALKKRGVSRIFVKYQSLLFFPLMLFESIGIRIGSILFLYKYKSLRYRAVEVMLLFLHFGGYFGIIFYALSGWQPVLFIVVHQALFGLYISSVVAPNHKGMLILPKDADLDFLSRQVLTARNVKSHPITDFWYGGLNYQIEHHLFPSIARNKLRDAQKIIRRYCDESGVSYYETSVLKSYVEILEYLHMVSAPLRMKPVAER